MFDRRIPGTGASEMADAIVARMRLQPARVVQLAALAVATWTLGMPLGSSPNVGAIAFSKDGRILIGAVNGDAWGNVSDLLHSYGTVRVWDAATGKARATLTGGALWLRSISISADGSTLAVAGDSPSIALWDIRRGIRSGVLEGHVNHVAEVAFASSGNVLGSASYDGEVRVWDIASKTSAVVVKVDQYGAHDLCFTPDGQTLAACDSKGVGFWSKSDGRLVKEIPGERLGFLGFTEGGSDFLLVRFDARHGHVKTVLDGATKAERFVARPMSRSRPRLSPDGRAIAFGDFSGLVSVLDAVSGREFIKADGLKGDIRCLAFSPDGTLLAAGDEGGTVCVWESGTGRLRSRFTCYNRARQWGPTAAALVVLGLATLRLRRARRGVVVARGTRFWNGIRRKLFVRIPTSIQPGSTASAVSEGQLLGQEDTSANPEPMWDHWLDG